MNRCGSVKKLSGPTSRCQSMSQVNPDSEIRVPASMTNAGNLPRGSALVMAVSFLAVGGDAQNCFLYLAAGDDADRDVPLPGHRQIHVGTVPTIALVHGGHRCCGMAHLGHRGFEGDRVRCG